MPVKFGQGKKCMHFTVLYQEAKATRNIDVLKTIPRDPVPMAPVKCPIGNSNEDAAVCRKCAQHERVGHVPNGFQIGSVNKESQIDTVSHRG